jgi:predicted DNA-binding protein (MmcQ/YjbR family)
MTPAEFNTFCGSLPHTHHVVQWGGADVWKVATRVFAIARVDDDTGKNLHVTFKCSPASFEILKEQKGLRPAPYLASRGILWIQRTGKQTMNDRTLKDYVRESHRLASLNLPKGLQRQLGLNQQVEA